MCLGTLQKQCFCRLYITEEQCVFFCNTEMHSSRGLCGTEMSALTRQGVDARQTSSGTSAWRLAFASAYGAHLLSLAPLFLISLFLHVYQVIVIYNRQKHCFCKVPRHIRASTGVHRGVHPPCNKTHPPPHPCTNSASHTGSFIKLFI